MTEKERENITEDAISAAFDTIRILASSKDEQVRQIARLTERNHEHRRRISELNHLLVKERKSRTDSNSNWGKILETIRVGDILVDGYGCEYEVATYGPSGFTDQAGKQHSCTAYQPYTIKGVVE